MTEPKKSLEPEQQVLKLQLPKELCSWMDNTALKRCALLDSYLHAKITPSGRYIYVVYAYDIIVFNVFCGTKKEYTIPVELVAYFPIDDTSGFALHTEANHLYVQTILFNFASGFFDDISEKQLLIEDCEKIKHTDTISFLGNNSQLAIIYSSTSGSTNFRCFNVNNWRETVASVDQFGNGDFIRFPYYKAPYTYAFQNRQFTSIKQSAERLCRICEVNPRIANTIPIPTVNRPHFRELQEFNLPQQLAAINVDQLRQQLYHQRQRLLAQIEAEVDLFELEEGEMEVHALDIQRPPRREPVQNANERQVGLAPRFRVISLHNSLWSCVCAEIPDKVANLSNVAEKFESEWRDDRLYLLWSFGVHEKQLNELNGNGIYSKFDYDLLSDFFNFMAIFDLNNLMWYPIEINNFSPRTDSPLLMCITEDEFLTLVVSQMSQPFRWSRLPPVSNPVILPAYKSILEIDSSGGFKSFLYRIPMRQPDSLFNLAQAQFNCTYPSWTKLNRVQFEKKFGRIAVHDHLFYNDKNALLELYIYDIRQLGSPAKPKPKRCLY